MPGPTRPLVDDTISLLGTEENYNLASDVDNIATVLETLARDLRAGRIELRMTNLGGRLTREHKMRQGKPMEIHVDVGAYFTVPPDYALRAQVAPEDFSRFPVQNPEKVPYIEVGGPNG